MRKNEMMEQDFWNEEKEVEARAEQAREERIARFNYGSWEREMADIDDAGMGYFNAVGAY